MVVQKTISSEILSDIRSLITGSNYDEFNYILLEEGEFLDLFCAEILNGSVYSIEQINEKLQLFLSNYINNCFSDRAKSSEILNRYINYMVTKTDVSSYTGIMAFLEKFSVFLGKYNFESSNDYFIELLNKNIKLMNMVNIVFQENRDNIIDGNIEVLFGDSIVKDLIVAYCTIKGIIVERTPLIVEEFSEISTSGIKMYLSEINQFPFLSSEQEKTLFERYKSGDESVKDLIIKCNLRLVVSIAEKYVKDGIDIADLIQAGNEGLIKAVDTYDYTSSTKFSSYASRVIIHMITKEMPYMSNGLRISFNGRYNADKYENIYSDMQQQLGREPSIDEVATFMGISYDYAKKLHMICDSNHSFGSPISEDDSIIDYNGDFESNIEDVSIIKLDFNEIAKMLDERECEIFKLVKEGKTYEEIGKRLGVSRQRVHQIYEKALAKTTGKLDTTIYSHKYFRNYTHEQVDNAIEKLHPKYIPILKLKYGEDLKQPERKISYDIPVSNQVSRALAQLRNTLRELYERDLEEKKVKTKTKTKKQNNKIVQN